MCSKTSVAGYYTSLRRLPIGIKTTCAGSRCWSLVRHYPTFCTTSSVLTLNVILSSTTTKNYHKHLILQTTSMMNRKPSPPMNAYVSPGAASATTESDGTGIGQMDGDRIIGQTEMSLAQMSNTFGVHQIQEGQQQYHRHGQIPMVCSTKSTKRPLPIDYVPSPQTVVIGRGKFCTDATGSKRLQVIAATFLDQYTVATSKVEKSKVVSSIVDIVEAGCPYGGAFVRFIGGRWWEVDGSAAREKVGYVLRDLLHDKYRSSSKSKAANRRRQSASSKTTSKKNKKSRRSTTARRGSTSISDKATVADETCSQCSMATQSSSESFNTTNKTSSKKKQPYPSFSNDELQVRSVKGGNSSTSTAVDSNDFQVPMILYDNDHSNNASTSSSISGSTHHAIDSAMGWSSEKYAGLDPQASAMATKVLPTASIPTVQNQTMVSSYIYDQASTMKLPPPRPPDWKQDDLRGGLQRHKSWPLQIQTVPYFQPKSAEQSSGRTTGRISSHFSPDDGTQFLQDIDIDVETVLSMKGDSTPISENDLSNIFD